MRPFGGYVHGRLWAAAGAGWTPDKEASLFSWMRGDDPGASINTTPDPHQYAAIPDRGNPGQSFSQATSANQPQVSGIYTAGPAPDYQASRLLLSTAAAATFVGAHNTAGNCTAYGCTRLTVGATRVIWATNAGSAIGARLITLSNGTLAARIGNGSASTNIDSSSGLVESDVLFSWAYWKQGTSVALYIGGAQVATGSIASPSDSSPSETLALGAGHNAANAILGTQPEVMFFAEAHDAEKRAVVFDYLDRWVLA